MRKFLLTNHDTLDDGHFSFITVDGKEEEKLLEKIKEEEYDKYSPKYHVKEVTDLNGLYLTDFNYEGEIDLYKVKGETMSEVRKNLGKELEQIIKNTDPDLEDLEIDGTETLGNDLYIFLESYKEHTIDELIDCILYDHIEESFVDSGDGGFRFEFHKFEKQIDSLLVTIIGSNGMQAVLFFALNPFTTVPGIQSP